MATQLWRQTTPLDKSGCQLQGEKSQRWQFGTAQWVNWSTVVLVSTGATPTRQGPPWEGPGETTTMEEVFIIMRGQDRNTGTVHLLLTKMVARCFVCCGLILVQFRHISQACFTQLYHWSAQKVEQLFPMVILMSYILNHLRTGYKTKTKWRKIRCLYLLWVIL